MEKYSIRNCAWQQFNKLSILLLFTILLQQRSFAQNGHPSKPNIVIIFMDDMGYGDTGPYGAAVYQTPNINRLAAEGMRFTHFYSAQPICTASRAGIMTGCYPNRIGLYGAIFPGAKIGISDKEETIARGHCRW